MAKLRDKICKDCKQGCEERCAALEALYKYYRDGRMEINEQVIAKLRAELGITDSEPADDIRDLAGQIIRKMPELWHIPEYDIRIGYVRSWDRKTASGGRTVYTDCRKVTGPYLAYLPYDFVITVYQPNADILSDNQLKILLLHELKHVEMGEKGLMVRPHDIEDFRDILERYGIGWGDFDRDVPDILPNEAGAEVGE